MNIQSGMQNMPMYFLSMDYRQKKLKNVLKNQYLPKENALWNGYKSE